MKKYEIITDQNDENYGHIRALTDFGDVKKGDIGGKNETEDITVLVLANIDE